MKNKVIAAVLVIIILIPSVVAIVNYCAQQRGTADIHNTVSVTVTDPAGSVYSFSRTNKDDDEIIKFFLSVVSDSDSTGALPTTIQIGDFYQCVIATAVKEFGYKFYFTASAADCYYMDGDGNAFKLSEENAAYFLSSPYAGALYENGVMPKMSVSGNEVSPLTASWFFTDCNGNTVSADTRSFTTDKTQEITAEGGLSVSFPIQPDSLNLVVTDLASGSELFNDSYENIGSLEIKDTAKVGIEATAKWFEDQSRSYHGEQTYRFNASVTAPAQFFAGATDVEIGEFICVTALNAQNAEGISFSSTPDIGYSPVFFKDGEYLRTLIPFNWNLSAGSYALTFEYGGSSQIINVNLKARTNPFRDGNTTTIPETVVSANGSAEALQKCNSTLLEVAKSTEQSGTRYFDGEFIEGVSGTIVGGFGHTYKVSGTDITYRHTGVDYSAASGDVKAVNAGVVVYSGYLDYSGYTVVVEHGFGLKSWYAHMSKATVDVGDKVERGSVVGACGSSGFIAATGAHVGLTVFDVPVCQYALWSDGARHGIPLNNGEQK